MGVDQSPADVSVLEVQDLGFTHLGQTEPTISEVNLTVQAGELVAIAGPTGSGKSTILNCIAGISPTHTGGTCRGKIILNGAEIQDWSLARRSDVFGILLQNVETQIFCDRVYDELVFGLENRNVPPTQIRVIVEQALVEFGLDAQRYWPIRRLSAGQKQRLLLACLLTTAPPILLLDEPFAFLDRLGVQLLVNRLQTCLEQGQAIVLIEHRLAVVQEMCDRIYHIQQGCLSLSKTATQTRSAPPPVAAVQPQHTATVIHLENVSYGGYPAFPELSIATREIVLLKGDNGSGKTTLLRLMAGLLKPATGMITICGQTTRNRSVVQIAKQVGFVLQNPNHQLFAESVRAEILQPGVSSEYADQLLSRMNLTASAEKHPHALSQGQKRRLALAAVLARQPQICLLDEIMVGQDPQSLALMLDALKTFTHSGGTLLFTSHDPQIANVLQARIVTIDSQMWPE